MKRSKCFWLTGVLILSCLLGAAHWLPTKPVHAQQDSDPYDDGTFFVVAEIDVDTNYNLNSDNYMEVEFDEYEDIDAIFLQASVDQDSQVVTPEYAQYGDDDDPAEIEIYSKKPVPTGHEYGVEADGQACIDDGEGNCYWEDIYTAYAYVDVASPSPQISSLSTYTVNQGDQGTLTVTGSNFIQNSSDQLTLNFSGGSNPFTLTSTPSTCTTTCTATFSYDFSGYPAGSYTLSVANNEGTSNGESFTVVASTHQSSSEHFPPNPCAVTSNPQTGSTTIVSTGTSRGNGIVAVSFSGTAFAKVSPTVTYGPYSTPSSIASNIAALITKKYLQYGLSAQAFGPNIVYGGTTALGTVTNSVTGSSFTIDTSSAAASAAGMACSVVPHLPCLGGLFPDYDTPRLYVADGITETPRQHITRKHIVGPATLAPKNTVYIGDGGFPPAFSLVQKYNFITVLENPFGTPTRTGIVFKHTFQKMTIPTLGGPADIGWIGADAAGNDLYTNELYLSTDRCTVNTSFPTP